MLKPFDEALRELVRQYESAHYNPLDLRVSLIETAKEVAHNRAQPTTYHHDDRPVN